MPAATASQTIGPYWHLLDDPALSDLLRFGAAGDRITVSGTITDGAGALVTDACVELWQADPPASETFPGWGRSATDEAGRFRFTTLKPGPVPGRGNALQAPHLAIAILARGLTKALVTRAYFQGETLNASDPVLSSIEDSSARATLIAAPDGKDAWRFDIRLQGANTSGVGETQFLEI
jgi:protocatechuate 3,4-dioxygenase alpha subunit